MHRNYDIPQFVEDQPGRPFPCLLHANYDVPDLHPKVHLRELKHDQALFIRETGFDVPAVHKQRGCGHPPRDSNNPAHLLLLSSLSSIHQSQKLYVFV